MSSTQHMTRRQAVTAAGAVGATYLAGPAVLRALGGTAIAATDCAKLTPALTEGP
ncbi:MAG: hypothetical protein JO243_01165, partial [Solirubrobacterales bacterium]|nr:hypothetical protein [Solirubrobacterales bacterium]